MVKKRPILSRYDTTQILCEQDQVDALAKYAADIPRAGEAPSLSALEDLVEPDVRGALGEHILRMGGKSSEC